MVYSDCNPSRRSDPRLTASVVAWFCASAFLLVLPLFLSEYRLFQIGLIASTSLISAGLVIVTGMAGQVSLAQAAFVALGAYGSSLLAQDLGVSQWFGIPLCALVSAAVGYVLGLVTLRVEGHYLALATMALTAIVQVVIVHWDSVTGGALGLAVAPLTLAGTPITSGAGLFYVVVPVTLILFALTANLLNSRVGRAMVALRQTEVAASTAGINVLHYKALAFSLSGLFGATGGGLQALQTTYLDPQSFGILESVLSIAIIVIGGFRSMAGAVLGSAVFTFVPAMLGAFQSYRGVAFALLLLATIVLFPGGLANLAKIGVAAVRTRFGWSKP